MKKRNAYSVLKSRKIIILIGGGYDEKLKDDFVSFFEIGKYEVYNISKGEFPILGKKRVPMILCTYDKEKSNGVLKKAGIRYKKDYVLAEDLFGSIDLNIEQDYRKIYAYVGEKNLKQKIYFCGNLFMIMHHICREDIKNENELSEIIRLFCYSLLFIVENVFKRKVVLCEKLDGVNVTKRDFIYIDSDPEENDKMIYGEGIVKGHKIYTRKLLERYCFASRLLYKTYFDKRQNKCRCVEPFDMFYINPHGDIWLCACFGELNVSDLINNSVEDAWNSVIAKIMRLSVENNTYTFCDRRCGKFRENNDDEKLLGRQKVEHRKYPSKMLISFDKACNLKCKSCRKKQYVKNSYAKEQIINYYAEKIKNSGWLEKCDELTIGGDGETFLSNGYKKILFEDAGLMRKSVNIMTNGTLFTPKMWEALEGKYESVSISVSIDATNETTYRRLRGGNFKQLMRNMEFLSVLRKEGKVNCVEVKMIVQEGNYREMKDFILWAKSLEFDKVYLSPIWNWGTYSDLDFRRISIFWDKEEREMKSKVKACLEDDIFLDPIVRVRWK